ncbi:hypothetical protein CARUB_v10016491mg [Capsella rubella]|uniref:Uncharacterized protein n=1 Tax=Capsella rubella TaxID=81985 RepID=R0I551_9BRAS|nr:hypothetical protein CARUB_v10016491mg [Capsella rubella]
MGQTKPDRHFLIGPEPTLRSPSNLILQNRKALFSLVDFYLALTPSRQLLLLRRLFFFFTLIIEAFSYCTILIN